MAAVMSGTYDGDVLESEVPVGGSVDVQASRAVKEAVATGSLGTGLGKRSSPKHSAPHALQLADCVSREPP